ADVSKLLRITFIPECPKKVAVIVIGVSTISTPKKRTMEKRIGNRLPIIAIMFQFLFSSVLSSLQDYGFSLWSAGSSGQSGSAEPLSYGLWCNSGVFPLTR
ncbi:hypothetical protein BM535_21050, partial [Clostridioides difficile]